MDIKPKRRWFHYSLRTLLVLVTMACAGFGWLGVKVRAKQREREAVKAIRELGGYWIYDYEWEASSSGTRPTPPGPAWLRKLLGDDFFANVERVAFKMQLTDSGLRHLAGANQLKWLALSHTEVTDAGLVHLKGLNRLETLFLSGTQVTDAGLVHLEGLHRLKGVSLANTRVTEAGVEQLQKALPNLEVHR
jgi:hypothetical protein